MASLMVASGRGHFAAVSFQFGQKPEEAMAILQDPSRYVDVEWDLVTDHQGMDKVDEFIDKHLGNRAMIWADSEWLLAGMRYEWEAYSRQVKWKRQQESGLRTLLWVAHHSAAKIYLPETNQLGMVRGHSIHDAITQVVLAQAAFWALTQANMVRKTK